VNPKHIAFIGLREIDPHESIFIDKFNIPCFSMREVDILGIREVRATYLGF
jgi:arginase family enzyme